MDIYQIYETLNRLAPFSDSVEYSKRCGFEDNSGIVLNTKSQIDNELEATMVKERLISVLDILTPIEEKVLRLRYGIDDGRSRTLEEVGKEFNVTIERIRQIEAKALRKLRHPRVWRYR